MNVKMQMIQFGSIAHRIQVKLMKVIWQAEKQDEPRISIFLGQ
jgi:hypothetical protein